MEGTEARRLLGWVKVAYAGWAELGKGVGRCIYQFGCCFLEFESRRFCKFCSKYFKGFWNPNQCLTSQKYEFEFWFKYLKFKPGTSNKEKIIHSRVFKLGNKQSLNSFLNDYERIQNK
jgi:hypothetical protein